MNAGIGPGKTRPDHRQVADQLYALYAQGRDLRRLVAIVGEAALSEEDRRYLAFAERFEQEFINQGQTNRTLEETFAQAWKLLGMLPPRELKRIKTAFIERYYPKAETETETLERPEAAKPILNLPKDLAL
jgi:V/A-type H+-transporting ATPase subunit B